MIARNVFFAAFLVLATPLGVPTAQAIETPASYLSLMDYETGEIIYQKQGDALMAPASMSKLMTMVMLFDAINEGRVTLEDEFVISENAWRRGGAASGSSTMFAELNSRVPVRDLIYGVIVQSGNDACIAIAEALAGSEAVFADRMTQRAREIGLATSTFKNATGWPDEGHLMTANELAILARYIIETYPEFYEIYAVRDFEWNGISQSNRNPLIYMNMGADGLKTGHTSVSGYGLTASAVRDGRRLILVVNGLSSERERANETQRLMDWAFREFRRYELLKADQVLERAPVWQGSSRTVPLVLANDLALTMSRDGRKGLDVKVRYDGPLRAPIAAGDTVGQLVVTAPGMPERTVPLVAGASVEELGLFGKAMGALTTLVSGQ
ncbi:D-alanyl-D-alanine carboxypeptidase family protein [Pyruvatibacter sp.]|uniref:D-alanyl-D-alanine carboxypeptidase family protein n=1 Tax=Pyruvatibacter sp. TaxID=1981328 RepID=UPI0032EFAB83